MISAESMRFFRQMLAVICSIFGFPGNILTIVVCLKALYQQTLNFERRVFDLYLAEISIIDTCLLLYWVIDTLLRYLHSIGQIEYFSIIHVSAFSCYFLYMMNRLFAALCSWLITCFTLIRFINIFRRFNTIRSNIILLTCLTVIFLSINSYLFIVLNYNSTINEDLSNLTNRTSENCQIHMKYARNTLMVLINAIVAGFINLALPTMITFMANIAIVCYIKRVYTGQNSGRLPRRSDNSGSSYRSTRSTLLVISITYTLCYLPYCILNLILSKYNDSKGIIADLADIAFSLRYISHSVNFYAYIFTNHRFRREIIFLLRLICRPFQYFRKRNELQKKTRHDQQIPIYEYRTPLTTPSNNSANIKCVVYQRPTYIRFQKQSNRTHRHLFIPSAEPYVKQQNTMLALITPSTSSDKCRHRVML